VVDRYTCIVPVAGIVLSPEIVERGALLSAIGRPATATLDFDVNEGGRPTNMRVQSASDPMWGNQATAFVSEWRFQAGTKDGMPISVPCSLDLMWGPQTITASMADLFRNTPTRQAAQQR
jgi:TonB family protein